MGNHEWVEELKFQSTWGKECWWQKSKSQARIRVLMQFASFGYLHPYSRLSHVHPSARKLPLSWLFLLGLFLRTTTMKWWVRFFLSPHSDFPGGAVDRNLSAISRDIGFISGPGRFHMPWSNQTYAPQLLKATSLEPVLCNERRHRNEKSMPSNQE